MIDGRKLVVLCAYRVYDSQVFSFILELNKLLQTDNYALFIYAINTEIGNGGDNMAEVDVFDLIPYDKADVIIIMDEKIKSREVAQGIIDKATKAKVPSIVIDGEYEDVNLVRYDYAKGFENVVRHIIEYHKVRRPHFMAGKRKSPFSNERIEVFKKVIAENGIEYDDSMLSYGDFWAVPARNATKKLLERDQLPEAVICANDIMALNVCDVLNASGVDVPSDVLISGFDGIDEAFWSTPGITTAKCDPRILARTITEVIHEVFSGKENVERWITPSFIANDSCGCPRCNQEILSSISGLNNRFYHHQDDIHIMQVLTSKIMSGKSMADTLKVLKHPLTEHTCIVIESSCFNLENNYFFEDIEKGDMSIVYDSYSDNCAIRPYNPDEIIPHLHEVLQKGCPLIFNGLEYMGKCPGFVCYTYPVIDLIEYTKIPSLTNCLGMGLGGYVINKYQKYLRDKIRRMYQNDALTGFYNRLAFLSKYDELVQDNDNMGKKLTILMADQNGLKLINDNYGHLEGDKAIRVVASTIRDACPKNTICARMGGDEFLAFILGDCEGDSIVKKINDTLLAESNKLGYKVSASVGYIETVFTKETNLNKLIGQADEVMYKIKKETKKALR